ncbi:hypothetical protein Fot_32023 [Forsythia ovata]|uniref:Uncharacterized protein n=1 Tax=Forsythia ovata TaxID=205694 RepID=A0ABD1T6V3_9LAMI
MKKEVKTLKEDQENLKMDLASSEAHVAEFSKKNDHTNQAQEVSAKALAEANSLRDGLVDKIAHLDKTVENFKAECSSLKEENLKLEKGTEETVKVGVENFRNQFEFTSNYENL